ncbi:MAG: cytochrome b/b6 domain-containing protein [Solirubrobacteraceae bacterium]
MTDLAGRTDPVPLFSDGSPLPSRVAPRYVRRFTLTERLMHWVHAAAFFVLLGTGLILYLPSLSAAVGRRTLIQDIHVYTAISWLGALVLIALLGNRRALLRTAREIDRWDDDDIRFLRGELKTPQGRFNAGQKLNAIVSAAFAVLFFVSGMILWLGEQNTDIRLDGTLYLHDVLMYISVAIVAGHLFLALLNPSTRHSTRGMVLGTVRQDWAAAHHRKWQPPADFADRRRPPTTRERDTDDLRRSRGDLEPITPLSDRR